MKKIFLCLLLLTNLLVGESDFFNPGLETSTEQEDEIPSNITSRSTTSSQLFASYNTSLPKKAYTKQLIPLHVKIIAIQMPHQIHYEISDKEFGTVYDFNTSLGNLQDGTLEKTIFYKAKKESDFIPSLSLTAVYENNKKETIILPKQKIQLFNIADNTTDFIQVFANKFDIVKYKTSRFDEQNLIMVLEINTDSANSDDINFSTVSKQGIDSKDGFFPKETLFYYLIFPDTTTEIPFSYFNLLSNSFKHSKIPVIIGEEDLSTQIGLNPKKSIFEFYKEVGAGILAIFFIVIFLFKRKYIFLIIALLLALYIAYKRVSFVNLIVKENTKVRILPTEKSTIFFTTDSNTKAEKLNRVKSYIKVLLPNGKIGWVKEDDIEKN